MVSEIISTRSSNVLELSNGIPLTTILPVAGASLFLPSFVVICTTPPLPFSPKTATAEASFKILMDSILLGSITLMTDSEITSPSKINSGFCALPVPPAASILITTEDLLFPFEAIRVSSGEILYP